MKSRQNKNDRKRQRRKEFHGRDWQAYSSNQRSPYPKSSRSGRALTSIPAATWRALNSIDLSPGAINAYDPSASLDMVKVMQEMRDAMMQQMTSQVLYGGAVTYRGIPIDELFKKYRPILKREMAVGEILAYRCWRLENNRLRSVYLHDVWQPSQVMIGRGLEDWDQRGVHAWKELNSKAFNEYVRDYLKTRSHPSPWHSVFEREEATATVIVTGSVHLWGDVVEHEHGYRAEFAKIASIDWLYPNAELMGREREVLFNLRQDYGVR